MIKDYELCINPRQKGFISCLWYQVTKQDVITKKNKKAHFVICKLSFDDEFFNLINDKNKHIHNKNVSQRFQNWNSKKDGNVVALLHALCYFKNSFFSKNSEVTHNGVNVQYCLHYNFTVSFSYELLKLRWSIIKFIMLLLNC